MMLELSPATPLRPATKGRSKLDDAAIQAILDFEAPYLIDKLLKDHIVTTAEEAHLLFGEAKRYLIMCHQDESRLWQMHSLRVDHCWHELVLFTTEYTDFCNRFFGHYVIHAPSNAPELTGESRGNFAPEATREEFEAYYATLFGQPPPSVWDDSLSITRDRRVINARFGKMSLRRAGKRVELLVPGYDGEPTVMVRIDGWAKPALAFVVATRTFYVREIPGDLTEEDRNALVAALVQRGGLRVGT
jgi:hypothetical protein